MSLTAHAKKPSRPTGAEPRSARAATRGPGDGSLASGALDVAGPTLALPIQRCAACEDEREAEASASDLSDVQRQEAPEDEEDEQAVQPQAEDEQAEDEQAPVQTAPTAAGPSTGATAQRIAAGGVRNAAGALPGQSRIQAAFGRHDVSDVRAQVGGPAKPAAQKLGARAYTTGNRIAFRETPDLRLAAHEAAHVVQQRRGVHLKGGLGEAGDPYERQADRVAAAVVAGRSAEALLDEEPVTGQQEEEGVQRCACGGTCAACRADEDEAPVQMQLAVTATRQHEPPPAGGGAEKDGAEGEAAEAEEPAEPEPEEATEAAVEGEKDGESALEAAEADEGGPPTGEAATGEATAEGGGGEAGGEGAGAQTQTTGAGEAGCQGAGSATCYTEPAEEPEEEPDEQPPEPAPTQSEEQMQSESPEAEEADDCPIEEAVEAQAEASAPAGGTAEAAGVAEEGGGEGAAGAPEGEAEAAGGAAPAEAGAEAATTTAQAVEGALSPMEGQIALTEGQRAEAVAAYAASSGRLGAAGQRAAGLASGVTFATEPGGSSVGEAARRAARDRARAFFETAAARMEALRARALDEIPTRLGGLAEAIKAGIGAGMEAEKAAISARIAAARGQALAEAAAARQHVHAQHAATVAVIQAETAAALATLPAEHAAALAGVDTRETDGLATVNDLYTASRTAHEDKGTTVGREATAKGADYVARYETCKIHRADSFWAGHLTDRRAEAQQNAAREVAKGYRESLENAAREQASEAMKGRQKDRCGVIAAARRARGTLDDQLDGLLAAVQSGQEQAMLQAAATRDGLLVQIDSGLVATLAMLDEQERTQRQVVNDTGYLQQVAVEQAAHAAAASAQEAVAVAIEGLEAGLNQVRTALADQPTPDPAALDGVLGNAEAAIGAGLDGLDGQLEQGVAQAEAGLFSTHAAALAALAGVTQANDAQAASVSSTFSASMTAASAGATATFAQQTAAYTAQTQQLTSNGVAGFQEVVAGFDETVTAATTNIESSLQDSEQRLEDSLREKLPEIDCEIPKKANEAAAQEAPAWKTVVAVLLIIAVIVVVALVIGPAVIGAVGAAASALGAGAAAGTIGTLVGGAIVGAAAGATIQVINNWRTNQALGTGVARAAVMGAIGGFLGAGAGALVGRAFSTAAAQALSQGTRTALQFAANIASDAVLEVGTQLVTTGTISWESFGIALATSILTGGLGEVRGVQRIQQRATFSGARGTARATGSTRAADFAEGLRPPTAAAAGPEPTPARPPEGTEPTTPRAPEGVEPAAPRGSEAEAPGRARTEAEPEAPSRRAPSEEEPRPPREVENEMSEPVRVGDEDHSITPRPTGPDGRMELWMCSAACSSISAKLDAMIDDLPVGHPLRTELEGLRTRVADVETRMASGESNVDVVRETADIANTFRDLGAQHPRLGVELDEPRLTTRGGTEAEPTFEPTAHLRDLDADITDARAVSVDDFRTLPIGEGDQAIYILRDVESGAVLKVGIAENHPGRFDQYQRAGSRLGLDLELEVAIVQPRGGKTVRDVEADLRSRLESEGQVLPWDNTGGRLGRPDRGTPFVHPSDSENLMWDAHGNLVQKGSGAPPPPPTPRLRDQVTNRDEFARLLQERGARGTAEALGVSVSSVYRWRQEWGL